MLSYYIDMNEKATYTLWNGSHMVATYPHTRDGMDAAMEQAHNLTIGGYGKLTIYSSRDDLVWSSTWDDGPECGMTDVEADADTLASAGYGTDEDYGYFGEDSYL